MENPDTILKIITVCLLILALATVYMLGYSKGRIDEGRKYDEDLRKVAGTLSRLLR
jgi:hypothetical protein